MTHRKFFRFLGLLLLFLCCISCVPKTPEVIHLSGVTMGTTYNIKFPAVEGVNSGALHQQIDNTLREVNRQMSTYDRSSDLSLFNLTDAGERVTLKPDTIRVIEEAFRLGKLTDGILDVTVGPLVNLWGFGPQAKPEKVPSQQLILNTKARTGLDKLHLDHNQLSKDIDELYVDLSTIAKGFGVDKLADLLQSQGINNFLVEIGGEMRIAGSKPNREPWRIAIEKPISNQRAVQRVLTIGDNAIATSGDYRNYYERDGVRYSHLIDPTTGRPINHNLVSVTVIHPSSMTADGLSTALMVMGKDKALALAQANNLAVLLITRENDSYQEYTSEAFNQYLPNEG